MPPRFYFLYVLLLPRLGGLMMSRAYASGYAALDIARRRGVNIWAHGAARLRLNIFFKECINMKYDSKNKILWIEDLSQCNKWTISDWISDHLEEVLESTPTFSCYTGRINIEICVIYHGANDWVVAVYDINGIDGREDDFRIQSIGYYSALNES